MGSRSRMMALSSRSGGPNGRLSPYESQQVRGGSGGGGPMPGMLEQKMQAQHMEIQSLLSENQRLGAIQVALRQELASAQQEMQRMTAMVSGLQAEKDAQIRSLMEKVAKLESELRSGENIRQELCQARTDCQKLHLHSQDLTLQVRTASQELQRARVDVQQIPVLRAEMDSLRSEMQQTRSAFEIERKTNAEQLEQRQAIEQNLVGMARELEKMRTEAANAEKRARANPGGAGYNGGYNGTEAGSYGMMHLQPSSGAMQGGYEKSEAAKALAAAQAHQGVSNNAYQVAQEPYRASTGVTEEWATHEAPNGKPFYHNLLTGATQWEKPAALENQNHAQVQMQPQITNAQGSLQTAVANQMISNNALSSLMNGQVQQSTHAPQQQANGASLIAQHQLGANGAQALAVGQHPAAYVGQQQPGVYLSHPGTLTFPGAQVQVQPASRQIQQTVAPGVVQLHTPVGAHVVAQAPQTTALAPMPHLVHGHLSYPGAGAVPLQGANGMLLQQQQQRQQQQQQERQSAQASAQPGQVPIKPAAAQAAPAQPQAQGTGAQSDMGDKKLAELFAPFGSLHTQKWGWKRKLDETEHMVLFPWNHQNLLTASNHINGMVVSGKHLKVELKREDKDIQNQQIQQHQVTHQHQAPSGGIGPIRWNHNINGNLGYRPY